MEIGGHVTDLGKSVYVLDFHAPDFLAFSNIAMLRILIFMNNSGLISCSKNRYIVI